MSAVAAAAFARPRAELPFPAGPVPERAAGHPLSLGRDARARLGGAVRVLLDVAGLDGVSDAVRLAVLVLASRTPSETGVVEIRTSELGRWLGVSGSYVASAVLPVLRRSGVVSVDTAEGEYGQDDGLKCRVLPLWAAQDVASHPLNLTKKEYATLLRLLEAVMAPGWTHRDGRVTPAGLIGTRTGRGAATDRLALLLLVLEARETGRVRQCGGTVDTKRGRAAATVARLLGCTASAGERVLERLEERGLVLRLRLRTGSGLANRSRLMVPAVASAHGHTVADDVQEDRAEDREPQFSDPDGAARTGGPSALETEPQVTGVPVADKADIAEPDAAAVLHTDHPHLATPVVPVQLSGGFSGAGRGGIGDLPGRVCAREDQAAAPDAGAAAVPSSGGPGSPLCGEMPKESAAISMEPERQEQAADGGDASKGQDAAARLLAGLGGRHRGGLRGRVPRPRRELQAALAPVEALWDRLKRAGARRRVEQAACCELGQVKRWLSAEGAEAYLAQRLTRRLTAQPHRAAGVKDPVGWLLERGLPRHTACTDERCDEGFLMHSGAVCELCEDHVLDLRSRRRRIAEQVQAGLPGAAPCQQHDVFEDRLREAVNTDAERAEARRREQEADRASAEAAALKARARRMAQAAAQRTLPCEECHEPMAGGLCPVCRDFRAVDKLVEEAVTAIAAGCGKPDASDLTAALAKSAETEARTRIQDTCVQFEAAGATDVLIAVQARLTAQGIVHEYTTTALRMLANDLEATAEANRAHAAEMRRRHPHPDAEAAQEAADEVALKARQRTAKHLLDTRSKAWRTTTPAPAKAAVLPGQAAAYATGDSQTRAAAADAAPAACPRSAWNCTDCGRHFIGDSPDSGLCAPCDGKAAGLSRAERFARLARTAS
ncbi:hypothetical protein Stsp01_64380 [Streptomyces sp. NBRC 13847]|uniref:hypothetical protein n=1 Tax=Streptomyces TaxID=1883 RepID=UPI0024A51780|nr:hypothetical protein [Streptomyces sp. NBRC 13847]GLW19695.1 hypothetical protein Stsp01_64380 [Streptomyces sp. NBRC 13847]